MLNKVIKILKKLQFFNFLAFGICLFLLLSDAKMMYLFCNGNGLKGLIVGLINAICMHTIFMVCFFTAFYKILTLNKIIILGSLLSCNACFYAAMRQSFFDSETHFLQPFLYWIPLLFMMIFFALKYAKKINLKYIKFYLIYNRYYFIATLYMFLLTFIPQFTYLNYIVNANYLILVFLCILKPKHKEKWL